MTAEVRIRATSAESKGPRRVSARPFGDGGGQTPAATGVGFSIGTPTMLPHSVQLPS
jgi:hypothetical protein